MNRQERRAAEAQARRAGQATHLSPDDSETFVALRAEFLAALREFEVAKRPFEQFSQRMARKYGFDPEADAIIEDGEISRGAAKKQQPGGDGPVLGTVSLDEIRKASAGGKGKNGAKPKAETQHVGPVEPVDEKAS
jgi:hypothetical protein